MEELSAPNDVDRPHFTPAITRPINYLMLYFLFITYHTPTSMYLAHLLSLAPWKCKVSVKKIKC